jgi:polysaccharide pyruvyl transferase WcaK-like protein
MFIELRGVGFVNKGAELMLHTILYCVKKEIPEARFIMERSTTSPFKKKWEHGIYTKFKFKKFGLKSDTFSFLIPAFFLNKFGYAKESQVSCVLDASGFAYGDIWGARLAGKGMADHITEWKKRGKKVILLPQAFGPFSNMDLRRKMEIILEQADLVFARDKTSYNYLNEFGIANGRLDLKPDFTNLIAGTLPEYFDSSKFEVAVIPNAKMIKVTEDKVSERYAHFLKEVIEVTHELGYKPFFLLHEGKADRDLIETVNNSLSTPIPVIDEMNPLHVKGIIGASRAVVTSRFHGLVSALSQAVPCLATGWSHKYEMLLADYDYPEGLCSTSLTKEEIHELLTSFFNNESRAWLINKLKIKSEEEKVKSKEMFNKVISVIYGGLRR